MYSMHTIHMYVHTYVRTACTYIYSMYLHAYRGNLSILIQRTQSTENVVTLVLVPVEHTCKVWGRSQVSHAQCGAGLRYHMHSVGRSQVRLLRIPGVATYT